jgi:hemin uptake protein HemP
MTEILRIPLPPRPPNWTEVPVHRQISSAELMAGERVIVIQHGTEEYRLRITASNRLILTK